MFRTRSLIALLLVGICLGQTFNQALTYHYLLLSLSAYCPTSSLQTWSCFYCSGDTAGTQLVGTNYDGTLTSCAFYSKFLIKSFVVVLCRSISRFQRPPTRLPTSLSIRRGKKLSSLFVALKKTVWPIGSSISTYMLKSMRLSMASLMPTVPFNHSFIHSCNGRSH
jgi:hypothetical protein